MEGTIYEGIKSLDPEKKARILDELLKDLDKKTQYGHGTIWGTNQIIDKLEQYAVRTGSVECPYCNRGIVS